jgi:hypothetical protein
MAQLDMSSVVRVYTGLFSVLPEIREIAVLTPENTVDIIF